MVAIEERLDPADKRPEYGATVGTLERNRRQIQQEAMERAGLNEMSTVGCQRLGRHSGNMSSIVENKLILKVEENACQKIQEYANVI